MREAIDIGSRLELFVDRHVVQSLEGVDFRLHAPQLAPAVSGGLSGSYMTVFRDGELFRGYYRTQDPSYTGPRYSGSKGEITCYAESRDGIHWSRPELDIYEVNGTRRNNVVLAHHPPFSTNLSPFRDENPAAPEASRYKSLAGHQATNQPIGGLHAFESRDGLNWKLMHNKPVMEREGQAFDSQNVSFWSAVEGCYVCYFRTWETPHGPLRSISRSTSKDYLHWSEPVAMNSNLPGEHLYTSQTHPYFRAPHIYVALPTRFCPDRGNSTDLLFMATRAGSDRFERLFTEALIRPGLDRARWGNRANYAACGIVPTGEAQMSIYHHAGERYVLRTDGFISINAGVERGEMITRALQFRGSELVLNCSTAAPGSIAVEIQRPDGTPIEGFSLAEAVPIVGDAIEQVVAWQGGPAVAQLESQPLRLRFVMREADIYSLRFR